MDQVKIGRFIAEQRKARQLTQRQLAGELDISDKTISKWETGKGLPEVSLMLPLCQALHITVNDLLSGEKVQPADYQKKAEENMMDLMKENQEKQKVYGPDGHLWNDHRDRSGLAGDPGVVHPDARGGPGGSGGTGGGDSGSRDRRRRRAGCPGGLLRVP